MVCFLRKFRQSYPFVFIRFMQALSNRLRLLQIAGPRGRWFLECCLLRKLQPSSGYAASLVCFPSETICALHRFNQIANTKFLNGSTHCMQPARFTQSSPHQSSDTHHSFTLLVGAIFWVGHMGSLRNKWIAFPKQFLRSCGNIIIFINFSYVEGVFKGVDFCLGNVWERNEKSPNTR